MSQQIMNSVLTIWLVLARVDAWIPASTRRWSSSSSSSTLSVSIPNKDDVLDVDFERVVATDDGKDLKVEQAYVGQDEEEQEPLYGYQKSLLDVSLESGDPMWKETRIPFCRGDEYIDGKLAFMVELDGAEYGIAVPFDDPVAIVVEENPKATKKKQKKNRDNEADNVSGDGDGDDDDDDSTITYIDPEKYGDEVADNQELMEIFAAQVKEQLGEEYTLRKTPKVLTISGGLAKITDNWERNLMPRSATVDELLEEVGEDDLQEEMSSFLDFMKQELGEEEFEKTMNEDPSDEDLELFKFFDIPGLGTHKDDTKGLEELMNSIGDDIDDVEEAKQFEVNTDGCSLKLLGFHFGDGSKTYSLVKLLQPFVMIGRRVQDEKEGLSFDLLAPEEEGIVIPKIEGICQNDLKEAGLSLSNLV